jgi:hypothetical protein
LQHGSIRKNKGHVRKYHSPWTREGTGRENPIFSKAIGDGVTSHHDVVAGALGRAGNSGCGGCSAGSIWHERAVNKRKRRRRNASADLNGRPLHEARDPVLEDDAPTRGAWAVQIELVSLVVLLVGY